MGVSETTPVTRFQIHFQIHQVHLTYLDFNFFVRNIFKIVIIMILHDIVASSFQFLLIKVYQVTEKQFSTQF